MSQFGNDDDDDEGGGDGRGFNLPKKFNFRGSKFFDPGTRVLVTLPFSADEGRVVKIVKSAGPILIRVMGMEFMSPRSYQVEVEGVGSVDEIGRPIVYPPEFLEEIPPPLKSYTEVEKSSWTDFDSIIGDDLATKIRNGEKK